MSATTTPDIQKMLQAALAAPPASYKDEAFHSQRQQSPYVCADDGTWTEMVEGQTPNSIRKIGFAVKGMGSMEICLISWNIDMLVPFPEERMSAALQYLEQLVSSVDAQVPVVIFLQEMLQSDLAQIRESKWIQNRFILTDIDESNWLNPVYGTITLVDYRLKVKNVFRVRVPSRFDRDGLFVDVGVDDGMGYSRNGHYVLRLCNTHLESLVADPPVRPLQLAMCAKYLHGSGAGFVDSALLAGDLNAIEQFDRKLPSSHGFKDAYLEMGGSEDTEEGMTWGQQVPQSMREKFGLSRMDKILFSLNIKPVKFERIGMGVMVAEEHRSKMKEAGQLEFVTDHYGVKGQFRFTGWLSLSSSG